jgi:hypothetical protein
MSFKAGNKKSGFGPGSKKMGGSGQRPPRQSVGTPRGKAPPKSAPPAFLKKGMPPMPSDNDGDEMMPAMKKGGKVKAMKKGGKC